MRTESQIAARVLAASVALAIAQLGCAAQSAKATAATAADAGSSVVVEALSRGKGVADATYEAMTKARSLLQRLQKEGKVVQLEETRLGLEGETRLCAEFKDSAAASAALEQLRAIAHRVELLNVVAKPCDNR